LNEVTFEFKNLDKVIKAMSGTIPYAKVGVLGDHSSRKEGEGLTNADIGAIHEFGAPGKKIKMRSWLRKPLMMYLQTRLYATIEKEDKIDLNKLVHKIAAIAKGIVVNGFTNNGYGMWATTKKMRGLLKKGVKPEHAGNILVDTQQLRDSVDFEVIA